MMEKLRSIAKRAGLDPSRFWLHKFRAMYAVGRLRAGVDVDTLREWLGHKGTERLRAYLVHMNNEEAIESGKIDAGYAALRLAAVTEFHRTCHPVPQRPGRCPSFRLPSLGGGSSARLSLHYFWSDTTRTSPIEINSLRVTLI